MVNNDITMRVNRYTLESLIGGIHDLAEGLINSSFQWRATHLHDDKEDLDEWICEKYDLVAGAVRLIAAASEIVDIGLVNNDIRFAAGSFSETSEATSEQSTT